MAKISNDTASKLAKLARLAITSDQAKKISKELGAILGYVEQLDKVDVKGVEEVSQVTGLEDVWRKDEVIPGKLTQKELLANTPATERGYIKVKRVL
jgi:aspartyl-tRNA(Asn)/glutamyl-tRNA(Gln) amidotransferase subunit C